MFFRLPISQRDGKYDCTCTVLIRFSNAQHVFVVALINESV